ncbi:MAG: beta-propeller fold lactonase family protein [Clostridium sp.]
MKKIIGIISVLLLGISIKGGGKVEELKFEEKDGILISQEIFKVKSKENMQGITYNEGKYYIGYDVKNGEGVIETYTKDGKQLDRSNVLKIGHSAGLAFNKNDGHIYVANGGGRNKTKIYKVSIKNKMEVVKEYDFERLGNSALIAIDNEKNEMVLHTSNNDKGKHIFSRVDMDGNLKREIQFDNLGVPQGLEYFKEHLYFYTNNIIWIIDLKEETIVKKYEVNEEGESEGITFVEDEEGLYISYGYNKENRIYRTKIDN